MTEMEKKKKLRADLVLIGALLLFALALWLRQTAERKNGGRAVVYVDGVYTASYPLSRDAEVRLPSPDGTSYNVLVIADGTADVTDAGCPDKICVQMHPIRYAGESIICLPNRTVITIEGGESSGVDVGVQ